MVFIVLRNGKTLQYNNCKSYKIEGEMIVLYEKANSRTNEVIAAIPVAVVERIEWDKPCRVYREKAKKYLPLRN
jgi:hypothetical protein